MTVIIRQATPDDQERIGRFLQIAYRGRAQYKFPARWSWQFVENPFWDGNGLPIWLAEADDQIVGQTCVMMVPLKWADRSCLAGWAVDTVVLPDYRRQGIGRQLQATQTKDNDIVMGLMMSPITRRFKVGLGWEEANPVIELYKTIRFSPQQARAIVANKLGAGNMLSSACRLRHAAGALATSLSFFKRLRDLLGPRTGIHSITVERVERFDDGIDQLWTRLAPHFPLIVQRDAAYLNWKFAEQPHMDYDKFVARRGQTVSGYVITRTGTPPEARMGIIADLFAASEDDAVLRRLLVHAIGHLRREGVNGIIAASSVPEYVAHFLQQGFRRTRELIPMFRSKTVAQMPTDGWFLSVGDHDWDQYPLMTETQPGGG